MSRAQLAYLTIAELAGLYRERALSPVEVTTALLERVHEYNGSLNTYLTVCEEVALDGARASEQRFRTGEPCGVMDGIPFGAKDVYDTRGIETTAQSRVFRNRIPNADAAVIRRLLDAGSILLGKMSLTEFGGGTPQLTDLPPPARNPWDPSLSPGSSSSGPAAGVAAGLCTFSVGTDGGGSIRDPASCCGVVGIKPTNGLVSTSGCIPLAWSLDTCGPLARSVADASVVLETIAERARQPRDTSAATRVRTAGPAGLRVGVPTTLIEMVGTMHPEVQRAYEQALRFLEANGARIDEVTLPLLEYESAVFATIVSVESLAYHSRVVQASPDLYGESFATRLDAARQFDATDYAIATHIRSSISAAADAAMMATDLLVLPTRLQPAEPFGGTLDGWRRPSLVHFANVTGQPALTLPCGYTSAGLPVGLQIVGRRFDEPLLLAVAAFYESHHDWAARRPTPTQR